MGAIPTEMRPSSCLPVLFSTATGVVVYGLVAATYADFLQGLMIIVSLDAAGSRWVGRRRGGGLGGLRYKLGAGVLRDHGAPRGLGLCDPWFVVDDGRILGSWRGQWSLQLAHVMTRRPALGKNETEARFGMVYGNFIKRLLTIAWAFTGLIALAAFPEMLAGLDPDGQQARQVSETLFGHAIQRFLGDGWRGLMVACLIAGVTSAETFMIGGSALFTRNFYVHAVFRTDRTRPLPLGRATPCRGGPARTGHPAGRAAPRA